MLSKALTYHVELHRGLGFKFHNQHGLLRSFVSFAEAHGETIVHVDRVLEWARQAPSSAQRRNRLVTVRRFALALHAEDSRHEVPPADALGRDTFRRRMPYIYTPDEIARLMAATAMLPAAWDRPLTYATLFGLLAATGMRISEALALHLDDITTDGLVIRRTKFQKAAGFASPRHGPIRVGSLRIGSSPNGDLRKSIVRVRQRSCSQRQQRAARLSFAWLGQWTCAGKPDQRAPLIHDLRHTYAVRSPEQCGSEPDKVARHLPRAQHLPRPRACHRYLLAYLQATQILMTRIAEVSESAHQGGVA